MSTLKQDTTSRKVPVKRSRSGCHTCRARHIKCDEGLPNCNNCIKSKKICRRGKILSIFKTVVGGGTNHSNTNYNFSKFRFLDQSYTVHKIYLTNKFHNYNNWLKYHSKFELLESDEDFKKSIEAGPASGFGDLQHLSDGSDSETISNHPSAATSEFSTQFDLPQFISKVLSFFVNVDVNDTLFVLSHRELILQKTAGLELPYIVDNDLKLSEFNDFINYIQNKEIESSDYLLLDNSVEEELVSLFSILLNSLVLALKTNRVYFFQQSLSSSQISSFINQTIQRPQYQSYENLMVYFEFLILDLNESLKTNNPPLATSCIHDSSSFDFLLNTISNLNLVEDLNYFIIRITIILIKLNNIHHFHDKRKSHSLLSSLISITKSLKDLENNHILTMYFPIHSRPPSFSDQVTTSTKSWNTPSPLSRNSSSQTQSSLASLESETHEHHLPTKFEFYNFKTQRFHVLYNYVLYFIAKHYSQYLEVKKQVFDSPSLLLHLWTEFEADITTRMKYLISNYNFGNDHFMSFVQMSSL